MLRAVLIAGFILVLLVAALFGSGLPETLLATDDKPASKEECNLLTGPCEWSDGGNHWRVDLSPPAAPDEDQAYLLTLTTEAAPERFLAVLRGVSMYMGEYPVPLVQSEAEPHTYTARFVSPVCSTGSKMIWRVDLQQGQKIIDHIPVNMVFQALHQ
jgi:hypothetical protein